MTYDEDFQDSLRTERHEERRHCDPPEPDQEIDDATFDSAKMEEFAAVGGVSVEQATTAMLELMEAMTAATQSLGSLLDIVLGEDDRVVEERAHDVVSDLNERSEDGSW